MCKKLFYLFLFSVSIPLIGFTVDSVLINPGSFRLVTEHAGFCRRVENHTNISPNAAYIADDNTVNNSAINEYMLGNITLAALMALPPPPVLNPSDYKESFYYQGNVPAGRTIMLPLKTLNEWQEFINNPPNGVSVLDCCAKYC